MIEYKSDCMYGRLESLPFYLCVTKNIIELFKRHTMVCLYIILYHVIA